MQQKWKLDQKADKMNNNYKQNLSGIQPLLYRGLAFLLNRLDCNLLKTDKNPESERLKNAGKRVEFKKYIGK